MSEYEEDLTGGVDAIASALHRLAVATEAGAEKIEWLAMETKEGSQRLAGAHEAHDTHLDAIADGLADCAKGLQAIADAITQHGGRS